MPCLLKHEAKLCILCKTFPDYIDVTTLLLQTTEPVIIPTSKFSTFLHYAAPPSKHTRMLKWLMPISVSQVTYLKTSQLCLFEKCILLTPFELHKETFRITPETSQDAHNIKTRIPKFKVESSFTYQVTQGKNQFNQEAS